MPRAHRNFLPGYVYHITHRCHNRSFMLQLDWTKQRWLHWLVEAKSRYQITILNYAITGNHIHLLVAAVRDAENIAKSIQLIAGRTAQEYNISQGRLGAFWQDRYHATAIDSEMYLLNCLVYIDLNMVRANIVKHPIEWPFGGFREIMGASTNNTFIDLNALLHYLDLKDIAALRKMYASQMDEKLHNVLSQETYWSESLAVGRTEFVRGYQQKMGSRGRRHQITEIDRILVLHEPEVHYYTKAPLKINMLSGNNELPLDLEADLFSG
jgi:putative transposase